MKPPLAVDLDGTLIHGDLFAQAMLKLLTRTPWRAPLLLVWLLRGRANAKAHIARLFPCDPPALPYDQRVVDWLRAERAEGRTIVLATAYDRRDAERVAAHLGFFDRVIASEGVVNLKSHRKAEALCEAFPDGFVYAGNERADLHVWAKAAGAVIVNAAPDLESEAKRRFTVERIFPRA